MEGNCLKYRANTLFLYRDLKPANILVHLNGHVKIADFGLSVTGMHGRMVEGMTGTVSYFAPEVSKGPVICWYNMLIHRANVRQCTCMLEINPSLSLIFL